MQSIFDHSGINQEINHRKITRKYLNISKIINTLLKSKLKQEHIFELNTKENNNILNIWDKAYAVLGGKCIILNAYIREEERVKLSSLYFHLKKLERKQHIKSRESRRKQILKITTEIINRENPEGLNLVY